MTSRRFVLGVLALAFAAAGLLADVTPRAQPVEATFPGANGKIAFVSDRDGNQEIYVMNVDGSQQTNLTNNPADDSSPAWSPDGGMIAFTSDRDGNSELYLMRSDGMSPHRVTNNPATDRWPAWSPDASKIAFSSDRAYGIGGGFIDLFLVSVDGSELRRLTAADTSACACFADWSPDGSRIAFIGYLYAQLLVINADGTDVRLLQTSNYGDYDPDWSPDGSTISFSGFEYQQDHEIHLVDVKTAAYHAVTENSEDDKNPAYSPDGRRLAFCRSAAYAQPADIYVMHADGTGQQQLTQSPADDCEPDWQPIVSGNANCQGGIDAVDAAIVLQLGAGLLDELPCAEDADVNNDTRIDATDAALILQYTAGLIDSFPA